MFNSGLTKCLQNDVALYMRLRSLMLFEWRSFQTSLSIQLNVQSIVITCGTDSSMNCANFTDAFLVVNTDRAVKLTQIQISKAGWARPTTSKRDKILRASCARLPPGDLRQSNDFTLGLFILLSFINIFAASLNLLSTITNSYLNKSTWHIQLWDYLIPDYRHILLLLQLSGDGCIPEIPPPLATRLLASPQ